MQYNRYLHPYIQLQALQQHYKNQSFGLPSNMA